MEKETLPEKGYILTVCLNPVLQKTLILPHLWENEVNRSKEHYFDVSGKALSSHGCCCS